MGTAMRSLVINFILVGLVVSDEFSNNSIVSNFTTDAAISLDFSFALDFSNDFNSSLINNGTSFQSVSEDTTEVNSTTDSAKTLERSEFFSEMGIGNFTNATWFTEENASGIEINNDSSPVLALGDFRDEYHNHKYEDGRFFSEMENSTNSTSPLGSEFFTEFDDVANETNNESSMVLSSDLNTDVGNIRNAKAIVNETSPTSSLAQPSESDSIENKEDEFSTETPARDFWGFKNTFSKIHPWVGWFVGVPSTTVSSIDTSNTDPTTELPREMKTLTDSDRAQNLVNLPFVNLNDSSIVELGNFSDVSSDLRSPRSDEDQNNTIFVASENGTHNYDGDINQGHILGSNLTTFINLLENSNDSQEYNISKEFFNHTTFIELNSTEDERHQRSLTNVSHDDWMVNNTLDHIHNESCGPEFNVEGFNATFIDLNSTTEDERQQRSLTNVSHANWMVNNTLNHAHNESCGPEFDVVGFNAIFIDLNSTTEDERDQRSLTNVSNDDWMVNNTLSHAHNESCGPEFDVEGFNATFIDLNSTTEDERHQRSLTNVSHDDWMVNNTLDHVHNESCGPEFDVEGFNATFIDLNSTTEDERQQRSLTNVSHTDWMVNNTLNHVHNESCGPEFDVEGFSAIFIDINSTTEDVRQQRSLNNVSHEDWMINNTSNHVHDASCGPEFHLEGVNDSFIDLLDNITGTNITSNTWMINDTSFSDLFHNSSDNERDMRSLINVTNSMINGTSFLTEDVLNDTKADGFNLTNLTVSDFMEMNASIFASNINDLNRTLWNNVANLIYVNGSESPLNSFLIDSENSTTTTVNREEKQLDTVDDTTTTSSMDVEEANTNSSLNIRADTLTDESTGENDVTTDSSLDARTGFIFDKNSVANLVDESFDKLSLTDFLHEFPADETLTLKDILDKVPTHKPLVISKLDLSDIIHKPLDKPSLDELLHKDKLPHDHHKPSKPTTKKPGKKTTIKPPKSSTSTTAKPTTSSPKPVETTTMKHSTTTKAIKTTTAKYIRTTVKPKTSTYKPYPPPPYAYHPVNYSPDETLNTGIVDGHQAAGMSPPVFARPHEDRYTPDNYEEGTLSDQYELGVSGYSAPVFAKPVDETANYVCPSSLAGHPCPIWLMNKDPHCDTHVDCQRQFPNSMCCLYNCRRRCIGNVYPYKVKK